MQDQSAEIRALGVFKALCDLPPSEWDAALAAACGDDDAVRRRARALLEADYDASDAFGGGAKDMLLADIVKSMVDGHSAGTIEDGVPLPERLGPYRVLGVLGTGGMGVVYEAEQERPKRRVAIKTVHPHLAAESLRERFRAEVEAIGALLHPAIPQVYDAAEADGLAYMVMELIRGRPLDVHCADRPLRERVELLLSVSDGVAHAHAHGILHCDIKPNNILVTLDGQPKVLDFGLATAMEGAADRKSVAGTLAYMAPEQRVTGHPLDARTDVYALGVVAYEVLTGKLPERATTRETRRPADRTTRRLPEAGAMVVRVPGHGDDLDDVLAKAMADDPAERYESVAALADDLRRYLAHRPVSARRPTLPYRAALFMRRHRAWVRAALSLVAMVLLVLGGVLIGRLVSQDAREREAVERLVVVERRIDELEAAGQHDKADALFELFAKMRDHVGTKALYEGWSRRAVHEDAAGRHDAATLAWAEAVTAATDDEQRKDALGHLADAFAQKGDWASLGHVLARLGALGAGDDPAARVLAYRADVFHRDLRAAFATPDAPAAPVIAALSRARRLPIDAYFADRITYDGHDAIVAAAPREPKLTIFDRKSAAVLATAELPNRTLPNFPRALDPEQNIVYEPGDATNDGILMSLAPGKNEVTHLPLPYLYRGIGWRRADGGTVALLASAGDKRRMVSYIDGELRDAPASIAGPPSDADDFVRADFDGDGQLEVVVALGAWRAFDLRSFRVDDKGAFTPLARRRVGGAGALALLPRAGKPPLLVMSKLDRYSNRALFGEEHPAGPPAGFYVYEVGTTFEQRAYVPLPEGFGQPQDLARLVVGDYDGDGLPDIAAYARFNEPELTFMLRQIVRPDGSLGFDLVTIQGVVPLVTMQTDDDAADELLVRSQLDEGATWILGDGDETPPPLPRASVQAHGGGTSDIASLAGDDEALARVWGNARTLADLGLLAQAADNLEAAATMAQAPRVEAELLAEAATLRLELDEPHDAAPLFERALALAGDPALRASALAGAARSHLADIDPESARERYRALAATGDATLMNEAKTTLAWLEPLVERPGPRFELPVATPIAPPLKVLAPESLQRDAGRLFVTTFSNQDGVLEVPMQYDGGRIAIEWELDAEHLEIGSGIEVALRSPREPEHLGLRVFAIGGDLSIDRVVVCHVPERTNRGVEDLRTIMSPPHRLHARIDYWPAAADGLPRVSCRIWPPRAAGDETPDRGAPRFHESYTVSKPLGVGDYTLSVAASGAREWPSSSVARVRLARLETLGLTVRDEPADPLAAAHARYVNGDLRMALADYRTGLGSHSDAWQLMAELALSEPLEARVAALMPAFRAHDEVLSHLLRLWPERLVPLIARADPAGFSDTFYAVFGVAIRYSALPAIRRVLLDPAFDALTNDAPTAILLMQARANILVENGDYARARRVIDAMLVPQDYSDDDAIRVAIDARLLSARLAALEGRDEDARRAMKAWAAFSPSNELAADAIRNRAGFQSLVKYLD